MSFEYVFIMIATNRSPPSGYVMKNSINNCVFAPLCHDNSIYTVDYNIWSEDKNNEEFEKYLFCPSNELIIDAIEQFKSMYLLLALTEFCKIEPPSSKGVYLDLESIYNINNINGLIELGFDVVDQWTGISVFTNIGYSKKEVDKLLKLEIKTNKFGLIEDIDNAIKFMKFASKIVPEHTPLIVLKVLANK